MGATRFLSYPYIPHFTPKHWMLPYRVFRPGGVSHGSDSRRMGNPLSGGGIQFESILILPALSILPCPRPYRIGIYPNPTYPIYPIIDRLAGNPMDWITAWRLRNWPRSRKIGAPYRIHRPFGTQRFPIRQGRFVLRMEGNRPIGRSSRAVSNTIGRPPILLGRLGRYYRGVTINRATISSDRRESRQ